MQYLSELVHGGLRFPTYGVKFVTEDDLHLFGDVFDKKCLKFVMGVVIL
jgi:hypothetical protein